MLAVITARAGSVALPEKNIRQLKGKPLIAYTIEAALESGIFNKVIVSTDDREIADISLSFGAEVPFIRPEELSNSEAKSIDVVFHALSSLRESHNYIPEVVTLLQPTSPFRDAECIREACELFKKQDATRLISVTESVEHFYWMFSMERGFLRPVADTFRDGLRRQDLPRAYSINGAIYMGKKEVLLREAGYLGPDTVGFEMSRFKSVDINDILDFYIAETILERGLLHVSV